MDSLVFEESVNTEVSTSEFVEKQWLYVNDNNNQSYSSQVVLDTTPLANSGSYINWSEAFILMPLVLQLEGDAAVMTATADFDYLACLKSGYWNILHSLTCEFNNGNIIQQVPFLNIFCSFKNITSWSKDDLKDWSAATGFFPDTARSWVYNSAAAGTGTAAAKNTVPLAAEGTGYCNNRNGAYVSISTIVTTTYNINTAAVLGSEDVRALWNSGMFERQTYINYDPTLSADSALSSNQGGLMTAANCDQVFRTYVAKLAGVQIGRAHV